MAQTTKVFAPEGYHFMIKKAGGFYLMVGAYTPHTLSNGDKSSDYVLMRYSLEHPSESDSTPEKRTTSNTVRAVNSPTTVSRSTNRVVNRTVSGTSSGSSGSY